MAQNGKKRWLAEPLPKHGSALTRPSRGSDVAAGRGHAITGIRHGRVTNALRRMAPERSRRDAGAVAVDINTLGIVGIASDIDIGLIFTGLLAHMIFLLERVA